MFPETENYAIDSRVRFGRPEQVFMQTGNLIIG